MHSFESNGTKLYNIHTKDPDEEKKYKDNKPSDHENWVRNKCQNTSGTGRNG